MITASDLVDVDVEPTSSELWTPSAIFLANWAQGIVITTSYETDVTTAVTSAEARRGLVGKPYRAIALPIVTGTQPESIALRSFMQRIGQCRFMVPLYPDHVSGYGGLTAGAGTIPGDFRYRRYYAGGRVLIASLRNASAQQQWELAVIESVSADHIDLVGTLVASYAAGWRVWPVMECELQPASQVQVASGYVMEGVLQAREVVGASALDPTVTPGHFSVMTDRFRAGYPVFTGDNDWTGTSFVIARHNVAAQSGIAPFIDAYGAYARAGYSFTMTTHSRDKAYAFMRLFDCAGGRLFAFWYVSPTDDFEVVSLAANELQVKSNHPQFDFRFRSYVGVLYRDGTWAISEINSTSRSAGIDTLQLIDAVPTSGARRVSIARLMRFDSDTMTERWRTDLMFSTSIPVIEVLEEKQILKLIDEDVAEEGTPYEPPDGGDTDPVDDATYRQARQCPSPGDLTDKYAKAEDLAEGEVVVVYDPDADHCYYFDPLDSELTLVEVVEAGGTVMSGWEVQDDCATPLCKGACPDTPAAMTSWKQFYPAMLARAQALDITAPDPIDALSEGDAQLAVCDFIRSIVTSFADPFCPWVGSTSAPSTFLHWTYDGFAAALTSPLADGTLASFEAMTKAQAFNAFQLLWTRLFTYTDSAFAFIESKDSGYVNGGTFAIAKTNAQAAYVAAPVLTSGSHGNYVGAFISDAAAGLNGRYYRTRMKLGLTIDIPAGQKATRFYLIAIDPNEGTTSPTINNAFNNFGDSANSTGSYPITNSTWCQVSGSSTFGAFMAGQYLSDWIGTLALPADAPNPVPPADYSEWGYKPYTPLFGQEAIVMVGHVFKCIIGVPHL